jgi:DNA helicase INO80
LTKSVGLPLQEKNIWGPFLVVAPASVLNNWADELNRFCPDFRILPYWGALNERVVLRKNINPNRLYRRQAEQIIMT